MLLHLVKKDLLIAKKYVLTSMLLVVAIPIFIIFLTPAVAAILPFVYMVLFGEILILQAIAQEEEKYPKAVALLCASPYERRHFVLAKYALFFLIFTYSGVTYTIITFFLARTLFLDLTSFLAVLFLGSTFFGIYMPLEFKFGFAKAKFVITTAILLMSLGPVLFTRFSAYLNIDFSKLPTLPPLALNTLLVAATALITAASLLVSVRIFSNKDL